MASTNKTTNYDLSQYVGTDKPTYLSDYNGDMQKIDTQMKTNADNVATAISAVETATSTATSALTTAQSAQTTAESASSTATSASTTAGNAQSTANSALSTATSAQTTANQVAGDLSTLSTTVAGHTALINELEPVTLYENANGTTGDVDLTFPTGEDLTDYSSIEIFAKNGDGEHFYTKADVDIDKNIVIFSAHYFDNVIYCYSKSFKMTANQLQKSTSLSGGGYFGGAMGSMSTDGIYITKVIGLKLL